MKISEHAKKIKFAVMCTGTQFKTWQAQCIQDLLSMDNVELSLLIIEEKPEIDLNDNDPDLLKKSANKSLLLKRIKNINTILSGILKLKIFHAYKKKFVLTNSDKTVDLTELLRNADRIFCKVVKKQENFSEFFQDHDLKIVASYSLDFILKFGFNTIKGEILDVPRYGIWSFHYGDMKNYRGEPPCFWEIYNNDPVSGAMLQRLTDRVDECIVVKEGYYKTNLTSYSGNIDSVHKEAAKFPMYVVRDIQNKNEHCFEALKKKNQEILSKEPTNLQMVLFFCKIGKRKIIFNLNYKFRKTQWNIGVIHEPIENLLDNNAIFDIYWYPLKKSDSFFLADPFGQMIADTMFIFCETCDMDTGFGELTTIELKNNVYSNPKIYFSELKCHVSYPCMFNFQGETYLVPESRQNRSILLYKAEKFPEKWILVNTIAKDINAADSTIFYFNDMWWLMYTDQSIGENSSLCILYSENLFGQWKSHPGNPVKQDIRSARPAGTPFVKDKILYRPSQDCSRIYGGKITINKVKILTTSQYFEETAA